MEAVIQTSGRQFKVKEGMTIEVDYREVEPGATVEFGEVLLVSAEGSDPRVGAPTLAGARVTATVLGTTRGPKVTGAHFRHRKKSRKRIGHRAKYTQVRIDSIQA